MNRADGFTLIEIMVALAVFAIVSSALIRNASMAVKQTQILEDRSLAFFIAENRISELRIPERVDDASFPATGTQREFVTMANRQWEVETLIEATENEGMRRIDVAVYRQDDTDRNVVHKLTGFVGRR
jgi:general secretion pathway protein I